MKKPEEKQLGVKVNIKQWSRLKALAREQGRTAKYLLGRAIEEYLVGHAQKGE